MRKAKGIVTYNYDGEGFYIMSMSVMPIRTNYDIRLVAYEPAVKPYHYISFNEMYNSILMIAKYNDFYFDSFEMFGGTHYDIYFIPADEPWKIEQYTYKG